ncbi:MAG: DUF4835 family protein, partial [Bacteroidetes bacterium]|nr:DUF4835 family protein [Bacteroidota bacterium]
MPRVTRLVMLISAVSLFMSAPSAAQMVDCVVEVDYEAVSTTHKDLLRNFQSDVSNYVNNYNWGEGNPEEKVACILNIFIRSAIGENRYSAQVFVGSSRPIYNIQENTAVIRLMDELWEFGYIQDRPFEHNLYTYQSVASFLDFYMLLIMGFDYDTYEKLGGTPYFQMASEIASKGRSRGENGWYVTGGTYSR